MVMSQQQSPRAACTALLVDLPTRVSATGTSRTYLRYAALGDSVTYGIGDNTVDGYRGWARLLADAIAGDHDMSFCNLARPGATAADARNEQLEDALAHRPHLASLVVGLNDTMRSTWNPDRIRADLLHCADRLTSQGQC
jgi:lysophospholipase L1-like esterase